MKFREKISKVLKKIIYLIYINFVLLSILFNICDGKKESVFIKIYLLLNLLGGVYVLVKWLDTLIEYDNNSITIERNIFIKKKKEYFFRIYELLR